MDTPILDFIKKYDGEKTVRLHMPGHKGMGELGVENLDITEINGADSLYEASGIIARSEQNASQNFGVNTYYSTEGSSLAIRAMLYLCLQYANAVGKEPFILAGRNAHKTFISAVATLDFKVKWIYSNGNYLSCNITAEKLDKTLLSLKKKPVAVYLTSPDYLGNVLDVFKLSKVCKKHGVLLLIDCAHGSYLRFLKESKFPIDLGADACCSSAHKTLPVLTGGGYLHVGKELLKYENCNPKIALSLFGSTSPSYLIMASLDGANKTLSSDFSVKLQAVINKINDLKLALKKVGYELNFSEPLKITLKTKPFGYKGTEIAKILETNAVFCEFYDEDFVVMMFTNCIKDEDFERVKTILLGIEKRSAIKESFPQNTKPKKKFSIRKAILSQSEYLPIESCKDKVLASLNLACPPAVQIVCAGEIIGEREIEVLKYYGVKGCFVVKE